VSLFTRLQPFEWVLLETLHTNMVYEFTISPSQVYVHKIVTFSIHIMYGTKTHEASDFNKFWNLLQSKALDLFLFP
jgi:hypothetical protein